MDCLIWELEKQKKQRQLKMKALHVKVFQCEGIMDFIHDGGDYQDAVFFPEETILVTCGRAEIKVGKGKLQSFTAGEQNTETGKWEEGAKHPKTIGEIEVYPQLLISAKAYIDAKGTLTKEVEKFRHDSKIS